MARRDRAKRDGESGAKPDFGTAIDAACALARDLELALARALRLLGQKGRSELDLRTRLARAGFDSSTIDAVITKLRGRGFVDDAALALQTVDATLRRAPAGVALLLDRGLREGIDERLVEAAIKRVERPEAARARLMAQAIAAKLPSHLDPEARWRRALGAMARRGFGEEDSIEALRAVLGEEPRANDV
jgi:regulatory protein